MVKKAKMWGSVLAKSKIVVWLRILLRKAAQSESVQNIKAKILMKLDGEQQQQGSQFKYDSAKRVMADGFKGLLLNTATVRLHRNPTTISRTICHSK